MSDVRSGLTPHELVDALVASGDRPWRDLERVIPGRDRVALRRRALEAGVPIADEQGMAELVYALTDLISTWDEDLAAAWREGSDKREIMQRAHVAVMDAAMPVAARTGAVGRTLITLTKQLVENPDDELRKDAEFERLQDAYVKRRSEYIVEFGTVQAHLAARQEQLQKTIDGFIDSRGLPRILIDFREAGWGVPGYVRGFGTITLLNNDLTRRSNAPLVVSLIAGQIAIAHHDFQIVCSLIDRLGKHSPAPGQRLNADQVKDIQNEYSTVTGGDLSVEFVQQTALKRKTVLSKDELDRASLLASSFRSTIGAMESYDSKAKDVRELENLLEQMRGDEEQTPEDFLTYMVQGPDCDEISSCLFGCKLSEMNDDNLVKILIGRVIAPPLPTEQQVESKKMTSAGNIISDGWVPIAEERNDQLLSPASQLIKIVEDRIADMKDAKRRSQRDYLQNLHARECAIFCAESYSVAVSRMSGNLRYSGPYRKRWNSLEDACVHHGESTYLDLHGM